MRVCCGVLWGLVCLTGSGCRASDNSNGGGQELAGVDGAAAVISDPTVMEDGVSGGNFASSDGNLAVTIPIGTLPLGLRAHPVVSASTVDMAALLSDNETLVSGTYRVDLQSIDNLTTTDTVNLVLKWDGAHVPVPDQVSPLVYARVLDPNSNASVPILGTVTATTVALKLSGLPKVGVFAVVYSPTMETVLSDASPQSFSTQNPPWSTNRWLNVYNYRNARVRAAVATLTGVAAAQLTREQIKTAVTGSVAASAAKAGDLYQAAGFRQPNLQVLAATDAMGHAVSALPIYFEAGGSKFLSAVVDENINRLGYSFGALYIDPSRMNDGPTVPLGTILASVAHEMFHAIQNGYDIGYGATSQGYEEGSAATYGVTIDQAAAVPQVRTANASEAHLLSNYLGVNKQARSEAYSNQDFFAYVGRVYGANKLAFLAPVFEQMRGDLSALVTAGNTRARVVPPSISLRKAMAKSFQTQFGKDLGTIYLDYAKNRAMEHAPASRLRSTDPASVVLSAARFHNAALSHLKVDPETLTTTPVSGSFSAVEPLSTRVVIIEPSAVTTKDISPNLTLTTSRGTLGSSVKAIVYRGKLPNPVSGVVQIAKFGQTSDDVLTVLLCNVDLEAKLDLSFTFGVPKPMTDSCHVTSLVIAGTSYSFPVALVVGGFASINGGMTTPRADLPGFVAGTQAGPVIDPAHAALITVMTNPDRIFDLATPYVFNKPVSVFFDHMGDASLTFNTPEISNADHGDPVVFSSTGGALKLTHYSKSLGGRIAGTFSLTLSGDRHIDNMGGRATMTGSMTGDFDVELKPDSGP